MMKGEKTQKTIRSYAPYLAAAALVMVLVTVLALFAPAYAATSGSVSGLSNETIGLSYTGNAEDPWDARGTMITGSAMSTSGCSGTAYNSTLTITNKKSTPATLSFDYVIEQNNGTIQVDGTGVSSNSSFRKKLGAEESIQIYIKSGSTSAATKITLTNVKLVADTGEVQTTFELSENGSYTVDGQKITTTDTKSKLSTQGYVVEATPDKGYKFLGWYDLSGKKYISTAAETTLNIETACTITAKFTKKENAVFETGGQVFTDLNEANAYANSNKKITLISDGTLAAGDYTISSGITLLIPFDAAGTLYTATPTAVTTKTAPSPFRTLTLASGAKITVDGAISVGGQYYAAGGGQEGQMTGRYGWIKLEKGSGITVNSGGNLYAWGFVSGEGSVTVNKDGTVYEWFQIMDFRGGTETGPMITIYKGKKVFPISQYAVQNIEAPLTLKAGAGEMACSGVVFSGKVNQPRLKFIKSDGMFNVINGSLTKEYDHTHDRMIYTVAGQAELNHVSMTIVQNIDSAEYVLPLTNNMTVHITSGSKLTINYDTALLPGVEVDVAKDANLVVASDKNMYIYDAAEWGGYCGNADKQFIPVPYVTSRGTDRTKTDLTNAKVDVNGTLTAIGNIYTTSSGANICSSEGTGKFVQQTATSKDVKTHQYKKNGGYLDISCNPAKLLNADGSYTETRTASAGATIEYAKELGKWGGQPATVVFEGQEGTPNDSALLRQLVDLSDASATITCPTFTKNQHEFLGFAVKADATEADFAVNESGALSIAMSALKSKTSAVAGGTITLYAVYKQSYLHTVDWTVTGVDGVKIEQTKIMTEDETVTKSVAALNLTGKYIIKSCTISPENGAKQTVTLPADNIKLTSITSDITVKLELVAYDHIVTVTDSSNSETHYVKGDKDVLSGKPIDYTVSGRKLITGVTGNACNIKVSDAKTKVEVTEITGDATVTVTLVAYDHIVTVNAAGYSQTYYVKNNGNVLANNAPITYTATDQNVISGVKILPEAAKETHDATTATITDITDSVTVTVALASYDHIVTIKAGDSSETHYVKGDEDVLTNAAITYTAGDNKVITNVTGHTATLTRGEGDVNAEVTDGWESFTLSGINANQTVAVTLKDYDWTVNWTLEKQDHGITAKEVSRSYVKNGENAALPMSGFRATSVTGADSATVDTNQNGVVTISGIAKDLTVTVTARNYSYAVTWNVNGTESKTYLGLDKTAATYTAGEKTVITDAYVSSGSAEQVTHTNTKVTVTGISSDVTIHVTTAAPTTNKATYYFGDMSYEYKRNTVLYQWDGKSADKGQWIPVDSFAWQHKAGSRIYEFEDSTERYVVPNGSVLLVNGSNLTMRYTVTYTPDGELTNAVMTFTANDGSMVQTSDNTLSVILKPGKQAMVSSTFACDVNDQKLTNEAAGQVTVAMTPDNG